MISVREATNKDATIIAQYQNNMALETEGFALDPTTLSKGVDHVFENPNVGKYYVAELNKQVIGCLLVCYEWSEWRNGMILWIESLYISKAHRGKKIYSKMYHHLQTLVKADDALKGIRLYVEKSNSSAQKVYEKLGMDGEHYKMYEWIKK